MIYGYARVSTWGQDLESQLNALQQHGCKKIYQDKVTGTKMERKEFQKLLTKVIEDDTIIITKLDRFARTTVQGLQVIQNLFKRGIKIHILNMGLIENTPTGKLILTQMLAFAEFERDMIVERTQEGKAIARLNPNFKEGRPNKFTHDQINHALFLLESNTTKEVSKLTGISEATLYRKKLVNRGLNGIT